MEKVFVNINIDREISVIMNLKMFSEWW